MRDNSSHGPSNRGLDPRNLSDEDILQAMKQISGYLDITPGDFKEVYGVAYSHASKRLLSTPASEIMTREVHFVRQDQPVLDVADLMARTEVAGIPVLDREDHVVGVISEKDFMRRMSGTDQTFMGLVASCMSSKGCPALTIKGQTAADIMSAPAITVVPDTPIREIFALMREKRINRVPVTEEDRLAGLVSRDDVLAALASFPVDFSPEGRE
ncbi:MAG: CBS domain-containing protein [Desulfohalobiaceae bacterium]|nr:CBS domain-containing protein [Desulfohalobiaceae bacterium]